MNQGVNEIHSKKSLSFKSAEVYGEMKEIELSDSHE